MGNLICSTSAYEPASGAPATRELLHRQPISSNRSRIKHFDKPLALLSPCSQLTTWPRIPPCRVMSLCAFPNLAKMHVRWQSILHLCKLTTQNMVANITVQLIDFPTIQSLPSPFPILAGRVSTKRFDVTIRPAPNLSVSIGASGRPDATRSLASVRPTRSSEAPVVTGDRTAQIQMQGRPDYMSLIVACDWVDTERVHRAERVASAILCHWRGRAMYPYPIFFRSV